MKIPATPAFASSSRSHDPKHPEVVTWGATGPRPGDDESRALALARRAKTAVTRQIVQD